MKYIKKIWASVSLLVLVASLLTGCNTVQGAGQDIQSGGRTISNAASSY